MSYIPNCTRYSEAFSYLKEGLDKYPGFEKPMIYWNDRYTTKFGVARIRDHEIVLSTKLWDHTGKEERRNVVLHELAHLIAYRKYGDRGHGRGWKHVMRQLGLKPERCHSIILPEVEERRKRRKTANPRQEFWCVGCSKWIVAGPVIAKRIVEGKRRYNCVACGCKVDPNAAKELVNGYDIRPTAKYY